MTDEKKNICVVVLGDIGRSPRMQYHSLSLADKGHKIDIIGYGETDPMPAVKASPQIYYHYLLPVPVIPVKILNYAFKTIFQTLNLLFLLFTARTPEILLVQNPPAIPSLIVCWIFCRIVRAKLFIDWHNYAYSIMALNLKKDHILVRMTQKCEAFIGSRADHSFCVTNGMKKDLLDRWNIKAVTLYDKPPAIFRPISMEEKHEFLLNLGQKYPDILRNDGSTLFTRNTGEIELKADRPGLIVSSTSWTEDEDFSVLFASLKEYEMHHLNGNQRNLPDLFCFITGKGHLKQYYIQKIAEENWKHIKVTTPWLEAKDYPLMLASADLGVCLHTSSSGLDLPMKVVDMFGCCLPVLAYDFDCLKELVVDGENSYVFDSTEDLSKKLMGWFENFPNNEEQKKVDKKFRSELEKFQKLRWTENWMQNAYPLFN